MNTETNKIRIIFGLKIRQLRMQKGLSLAEVAQKVGFSVSYLNEIEKGKKFPKAEKVMALANNLGVDYDQLVSLKLHNDLEPIADILNSTVLSDLPLDMFGIDASDFVDLMSKAPSKISAFINTLKEISRTYDIQNFDFFEAVLRSYQEMHDNYFVDIEVVAEKFKQENGLANRSFLTANDLAACLDTNYGLRITETNAEAFAETEAIYRTNYHLILNANLSEAQKTYAIARELGYQVLQISQRPSVVPILKVRSFDTFLDFFRASYFAAALTIDQNILAGRLTYFLASPQWDSSAFLAIKQLFNTETDVFMARVTSVLSGYFQLNNLFLLGMKHNVATQKVNTTQQMHLRQLHSPHGYARNEHYCRRWLSLSIFKKLSPQVNPQHTIAQAQVSQFANSQQPYFVITTAQWISPSHQRSDTIGFVVDAALKKALNFVSDPKIQSQTVNQTCERCGIANCTERVAEPKVYNRKIEIDNLYQAVASLKPS
jgi:XRE family transcriptional regulator, fatty acid utilization regulator